MSRQVEKPIHALTNSVTAARQEVDELSEHLLVLQEDERRRIARELHDLTAQHLVAGTLGLMQITAVADGNPAVLKACAEVEASLDKGLRELRIFTYLLHPPNLESEGLSATLREFVDGFCRRTGLEAAVTVSGAVDYLPFDLQRTLLRVVQEALANVQRHAMASRVSLVLRQRAGRVLLRISDNGKGIADVDGRGRAPAFRRWHRRNASAPETVRRRAADQDKIERDHARCGGAAHGAGSRSQGSGGTRRFRSHRTTTAR